MKNNLLKLSLCATLILCFFAADAQNYQSAVGGRLGVPLAVSYKQFLNDANAFEIYGGVRFQNLSNSFNASAAYQIHKPLDDLLDGLQWYYGGGASVYFWNYNASLAGTNDSNISLGVQGYLGLDYTLANNPINITVDWVPTFIVNGFGSGFGAGNGSIGIRYILKK